MKPITFQSSIIIQQSPTLNGVNCHFHLRSLHLAVGLQVKDLKSIKLVKSLFVKRFTKITQLVPIICVCNCTALRTNRHTKLAKQKFLRNTPRPKKKNYRTLEALMAVTISNNVPTPS